VYGGLVCNELISQSLVAREASRCAHCTACHSSAWRVERRRARLVRKGFYVPDADDDDDDAY